MGEGGPELNEYISCVCPLRLKHLDKEKSLQTSPLFCPLIIGLAAYTSTCNSTHKCGVQSSSHFTHTHTHSHSHSHTHSRCEFIVSIYTCILHVVEYSVGGMTKSIGNGLIHFITITEVNGYLG